MNDDPPLEGPSYKVIPCEGSRKLLVFFSGTDRKDGFFDFWNVARKQRENVLLVNGGTNAWYQQGVPGLGTSIEETVAAFRGWAERLAAPDVCMFGVSMGGYGALLYAALLDARALAFGFDARLCVPGSRSAKRLPRSVPIVTPDLRPVLSASRGTFCIYAGEADTLDLASAVHLQGLSNLDVVTLRGVGHGAAPFIERKYGLAKFVQEFADRHPRPRFEEEGKLATLPAVVARLYEASETRRHGDAKSAERLARMAVDLAPEVEAPRYLLGVILEDLKRWQEAARQLSLVADAAPHFGGAHMHLANCERKFGRIERAIAAYRSYIALNPKGAIAHYWVGRLQLQIGQAEGVEALRRAAELEPENPRFSLIRAHASALSAAQLASSTSPVMTNDASGSSVGLIWCTPFEGALGGSMPYTHIQVEHVDSSKDFRGEKPRLNPGTYLIASFALDEQRGWLRLEFLVDDVAHRAALPKQGVSFRLLRQARA